MEGKRFQIRTDKKIDRSNKIVWTLASDGVQAYFSLREYEIIAGATCNKKSVNKGAPFYQQAGVLTFLKTSTQMQIWFNDLLEATWVYEDNDGKCKLRSKITGLKFGGSGKIKKEDQVSTHYKYELGNCGYSIIFTISFPCDAKI